MKLRVGYLKERKVLVDVDNWTVKDLEDAIRQVFVLDSEIIGVYLGEHRVNNSKTERLTSLGVVSGDLVMVRIETNGIPELDATGTQQQPMDISVLEPSSSVNDRPIIEKADESLDVDRIPDVLHERMLSMGFQEASRYSLDERDIKTVIIHFLSPISPGRVRCAYTSFFDKLGNVNSACLDVTIIRQGRPQHLRRLDTEVGEKKSVLYDYVQELKETVFGPDNPFLKVMFCGDPDLTLKLFNMCKLEDVIALGQTCKIAHKRSGSCFLDAHYWKKEFIQMFGEQQLPSTNVKDPAPYRKALFKKMREQDRAAFLNSIRSSARQEAMNIQNPRVDYDSRFEPPPRRLYPQRDPLSFDPLRNFDENFYGQEVYRPRNPHPYVPNTPMIFPHNRDDPRPNRQQPPDPDMPRGPSGFGRRNDNRFI